MVSDWHRPAAVALAAASTVAALLSQLLAAAALLALSALVLRNLGSGNARRNLERDATNFSSALQKDYLGNHNTLMSVSLASKRDYAFSETLRGCLARYGCGVRADEAFAPMRVLGSATLSGVAAAITRGLETGADISNDLSAVVASASDEEGYALRSVGQVSNALLVNRLGGSGFFPVFAGIGLDIVRFGSSVNSQLSPISLNSIAVVLFAYMMISAYVNARAEAAAGKGRASIAPHAALYCAASTLLFKAAYAGAAAFS